ncbi:seven transmembrane MLO family protein [Artemisia annua]|uniref:MLO-like protein n=1 Tax=Artemisia annua TaxID=35608 RepID=A0A2U1P910_ARTAN|nr:seven transmembrane MLO family protein [Artemisia annua]
MAGSSGGRSLEQTPTWAVATVCFVLIVISIFIEQIIHMIGHWFKKKRKKALYESLEKIKAELMLLGFISLLLTAGTTPITKICISEGAAAGWHPCSREEDIAAGDDSGDSRRRLLTWSKMGDTTRRILAGSSSSEDNTCAEGKVSFMSYDGVHQLHIFIFALALFHVIYSVLTMALGQAKMKKWKHWEKETRTVEYQFSHDPERFQFARDTSFGRRHLNFWSKSPILLWIVCFFRQFVRSVPKVDYLTLRHGFIMAHLAPHSQSRFDFQKYIKRSLEEDFKAVVGISPPIWLFAIAFLLFNTHGWYAYLWLPFIPLLIVLLIGTKLQVIITKMGLSIQQRGEVVQGVPVVQPGDDLFWFNRPRLLLYLINFVLFQNAFQLAFFAWTWYEFGLKSCFHEHTEDIVIRITMGVLVQILCSYVTLPLYALVTQMGSTMKPTIFNDRVATALRSWHQSAKKQIKRNKKSGQVTPMSSRPGTPSRTMSPVHLLRNYKNDNDSLQTSPRMSNFDTDNWDTDGSPSPSYHQRGSDIETSLSHHEIEISNMDQGNEASDDPSLLQVAVIPEAIDDQQHEVAIAVPKEFSFDKRVTIYDRGL